MAYALVAFVRMGHQAEARAGLLAYFNARPTGKMRAQTAGADYQISVVRYFGDGSEEPFFTEEGATNIEFDDWGLALWALGEYERKFNDNALLQAATWRGPLYQSARDFVVSPLLKNTESLPQWESRPDRRGRHLHLGGAPERPEALRLVDGPGHRRSRELRSSRAPRRRRIRPQRSPRLRRPAPHRLCRRLHPRRQTARHA